VYANVQPFGSLLSGRGSEIFRIIFVPIIDFHADFFSRAEYEMQRFLSFFSETSPSFSSEWYFFSLQKGESERIEKSASNLPH
jgi:hypothetical protein